MAETATLPIVGVPEQQSAAPATTNLHALAHAGAKPENSLGSVAEAGLAATAAHAGQAAAAEHAVETHAASNDTTQTLALNALSEGPVTQLGTAADAHAVANPHDAHAGANHVNPLVAQATVLANAAEVIPQQAASLAPNPAVFAQWRAFVENLNATYAVAAPHLTEAQRQQWSETLKETLEFATTATDFGDPSKILEAFKPELHVHVKSSAEEAAEHYADASRALAKVVDPEKAVKLFTAVGSSPDFNSKNWLRGITLNEKGIVSLKDTVKKIDHQAQVHVLPPHDPTVAHHEVKHPGTEHHVAPVHMVQPHAEAPAVHGTGAQPTTAEIGEKPAAEAPSHQSAAEHHASQPASAPVAIHATQEAQAVPTTSFADKVGHIPAVTPAPEHPSLGQTHVESAANVAAGQALGM